MVALNHFWNIRPCTGGCWAPWFLLLISHFPFLLKLKVTDYVGTGVHIHRHSDRGAGSCCLKINAFLPPGNAPLPQKEMPEKGTLMLTNWETCWLEKNPLLPILNLVEAHCLGIHLFTQSGFGIYFFTAPKGQHEVSVRVGRVIWYILFCIHHLSPLSPAPPNNWGKFLSFKRYSTLF